MALPRAYVALALATTVDAFGKKKKELIVEEVVEEVTTSPIIYLVIALLSAGLLYNFFVVAKEKVEVILVGCGVPKRGMGWYHAKQLIEKRCPSGKLVAVVEPYFLGPGAGTPPGKEFKAWSDDVTASHGVEFSAEVPQAPVGKPRLAIISGRTGDNPRLLREVIEKGCSHVFLEKPGAPTVAELEGMAAFAKSKGVGVFMGYNKNVTKYVRLARAKEAELAGATTTFCANNAYKSTELDECFERNAEGMLKNMAVHELALLVSFYGVSVDTIQSVEADKAFSKCEKRGKFTDFSKIGFTIKTKAGKSVTVRADRCGGSFNEAVVTSPGGPSFTFKTPDEELGGQVKAMEQSEPGLMPYFYLQDEDYMTLKETCCAHIASGASGMPAGIATIEIAIDTLKVAEYLTPLLQKACGISK